MKEVVSRHFVKSGEHFIRASLFLLVFAGWLSLASVNAGPVFEPAAKLVDLGIVLEESRKTFEEFAEATKQSPIEIYLEYPTRRFICGSVYGSASIVGSNDVMLTVAHNLYDESCKLRPEIDECYFEDTNGDRIKIDVASIRSGVTERNCLIPKSGVRVSWAWLLPKLQDNWAVARLKKKVGGVKPYGLSETDRCRGMSLVAVQGIAHNFIGKGDYPPSIQTCQWRDTHQIRNGREIRYGKFLIKHDCDAGVGASGGVLLNGKYEIIGLQTAIGGRMKEYDAERDFNVAVPIGPELLKAVGALTGVPTNSKPSPPYGVCAGENANADTNQVRGLPPIPKSP